MDLAAFYRSQLASHFKEQMMVPGGEIEENSRWGFGARFCSRFWSRKSDSFLPLRSVPESAV